MAGRLAWLRSTIVRFVIVAFCVQLAVTGGILVLVHQASQRALNSQAQELVRELRDELVSVHQTGGKAELVRLIGLRLKSMHGATSVILLADSKGTPIVGNLEGWPPVIPATTTWRTIDLYRSGGERPERMGLSSAPLPDGTQLLAGHVIDADLRLTRIHNEAIAAAVLVSLILALLAAILLARIVENQIERVVETATAVGDGSLGRRVPLNGSNDAFDALGHAVNQMLDRIETLVSQLRMMTDGLAHDLKSPVTRLKSVLERAIADTWGTPASPALQRVAGEADTLLAMLSTALLISRTEAGIGRESLAETDLQALLMDLAEIYGPLIEESGFAIDVECPAGLVVRVHRELLSQAIGNLIENALKYASGGKRIVLRASRAASAIAIEVCDDGPGIPADRRAEALRRFSRLDPARPVGGSGLGLALVEAVAGLHGGRLALEDNRPGLRVVLELPDQAAGFGVAGDAARCSVTECCA